MQLKPTMSKCWLLLLLAMLPWSGCKEKPQPEASPSGAEQTGSEQSPELKSSTTNNPIKPWSGPPTFRIYYEREPLSQEWLKRWTAGSAYRVEQIQLKRNEQAELPRDGDLYIVPPARVRQLGGLLEWKAPSELISLDQIKPLFTGHSFDPENRISLPWRWSPYVFYRKKDHPEQVLPAFVFSGWSASENTLWPEDISLLWAMKRHLERGSANVAVNDAEIKSMRILKEQLTGFLLPEAECWKSFSEGKIKTTFALASWRILSPQAADPSIQWVIPSQGTLIQFDHLMIPSGSPYLPAVTELVRLLMSIEGQNDLEGVTGYFPVRAGARFPSEKSLIRLPEGSWLDNSEFAVLDLAVLLTEPAPTPTPTHTPTPTPTPTEPPSPPETSPIPHPTINPTLHPTPSAQPTKAVSSSSITLKSSRGPNGF